MQNLLTTTLTLFKYAAIMLILKMPIAIFNALFKPGTYHELSSLQVERFTTDYLIVTLIISPIIETIIIQKILTGLLIRLKLNSTLIISISSIIFSLFHYDGYYRTILLTLGPGVVLSYVYLKNIDKKFITLFIIILHSLHNPIATTIFFLLFQQ